MKVNFHRHVDDVHIVPPQQLRVGFGREERRLTDLELHFRRDIIGQKMRRMIEVDRHLYGQLASRL